MSRELDRIAIIADDEDLGRLLLAETAAAVGLSPRAYADGRSALDAALAEASIAVVLLDVDMPGLDGLELCRRIRADPRHASVPIVMVTGHEDAEAIARAFAAGATDFITKPVNWTLLPRRLEYILRNAASAERIEKLAYYDTLTGLPNRQRCIDAAEQLFAAAAADGERVAIVYMDLNGFKRVNDTFGHGFGDDVLRDVSRKLTQVLAAHEAGGGTPVVSRFGGDEFVVLLKHRDARGTAMQVASACHAALREPVNCNGLEFYATPSVGIAVYPDDGGDVTTVLKHADTAMYQAKGGAREPILMYSPAMSVRLRDWLELEGKLRHALRGEGLHLAYQPKFGVRDGHLVGVEALVRWHDPDFGDIPPSKFIDIAEESGLIIELGNWVIHEAFRQARHWQDRGIRVPIAVNVSGKQLLHGDPARTVDEAATHTGVSPGLIEIEITESVLVKDSGAVRSALERLRGLGCRIALDDFGTGYSSLAYITQFPPDRIKIDKAFVHNLDRSHSDAAIAMAILSLGASLGVTVTAEGIEREAQLDWLRRRGCDEVQGFLMSRPLSAEALEAKYLRTGAQPDSTTVQAATAQKTA